MILGGLQKLTLIDYPGKIAATVFTVGCNFSCPYCHNPELVNAKLIASQPKIPDKEIFDFLARRRGMLEGVCVTGGEPTIFSDLPDFIGQIKRMGFSIKLDTNGSQPVMLERLLNDKLVDYVAMDIKAPLEKYKTVVGDKVRLEDIQRSVELTMQTPDYEFRSTILPALHSRQDILSIGRWLQGAKRFYLQQFRPIKTLDSTFVNELPFGEAELADFRRVLGMFFDECAVRE